MNDRDRDLVAAHNAITHYTLMVLYFATGHRPVIDPFCYRHYFHLQHNRCLISDKFVSPRHEYRIAPLVEVAVAQIECYLVHLSDLKKRLRLNKTNESKALVEEIGWLISGDSNTGLPMFFLLDDLKPPVKSITPERQEKYWLPFGTVPLNYGRHFLATRLLQMQVPVDLVESLLNHTDGVRHFFGPRSIRIPMGFVAELQKPIQVLMTDIGFEAVDKNSLPNNESINGGRNRKRQKSNIKITENDCLGPEMRRQARDRRKEAIELLVEDHVNSFIFEHSKKITAEEIEKLEVEVVRQAKLLRISKSSVLYQLYLALKQKERQGVSIQGMRHLIHLQIENSPINETNFNDLKILDQLCNRFLDHLEQNGKQNRNQAKKKAMYGEIAVSAAVFGGLSSENDLIDLLINPEQLIRLEHGILSVEFEARRYFPDNLTKSLLLGHMNWLVNNYAEKNSNRELVIEDITRLLTELGVPMKSGLVMKFLFRMARTCLIYYTEGYLRSGALQERDSKSLPATAWVRLLRDEKLEMVVDTSDQTIVVDKEDEYWMPTVGLDSIGVMGVKSFCKQVSSIINKQIKWLDTKDARQLVAAKKRLVKKIIEYQEENGSQLSELESLLCGWVSKLCQHGPVKRNIKLETIKEYFIEISEPLLSIADGKGFLDMIDVEYEDIYQRVMEIRKEKTPDDSPYPRIFDFHKYLVDGYLIESPEWFHIFTGDDFNHKKVNIDANLITYHEYQKSLELCLADAALNEMRRYQYAMLMMLGYWFQLRFGEAIRLQFRDLQYRDNLNEIWVQVSNNIYRRVKSNAGIRQIPLLGMLTDLEKSIFKKIVMEAEAQFEGDVQAGLFTNIESRDVIDRGQAARYINKLLRRVTGDASIRFHHMRHSGYTRLLLIAMQADDPDCRAIISKVKNHYQFQRVSEWIGNAKDNRNPLIAIADCAGHATEVTTLSSYIHCDEMLLKARLDDRLKALNRDVLSYALNEKYGTLQQRINRAKDQSIGEIETGIRSSKAIKCVPQFDIRTTNLDLISTQNIADTKNEAINPVFIYQVLNRLGNRGASIDKVSEYYSIDKSRLKNLVKTAIEVERISGFTKFYLINLNIENEIYEINSKRINRREKRLNHIRLNNLLKKMDGSIEKLVKNNKKVLADGLKSWANAHHKGQLIFVMVKDLENILILIRELELNVENPSVMVLPGMDLTDDFKQCMVRNNIGVITNSKAALPNEKIKFWKQARVILALDYPIEVKTSTTFNSMMFCIYVYLLWSNRK